MSSVTQGGGGKPHPLKKATNNHKKTPHLAFNFFVNNKKIFWVYPQTPQTFHTVHSLVNGVHGVLPKRCKTDNPV